MLPAHFVTLEALPLTPNGKLDQKRLPDPGRARPDQATPFVAPRNPLEEKLANIWAEVLDIEQVGIYDNFLDLGGHSLLATQLVSRVLNIFQVELSPRTLLNSATVAMMAALIGQSQASLTDEEDLEQILGELETLSEEEAQRLLAEESE
jgi:acyl carrier protein